MLATSLILALVQPADAAVRGRVTASSELVDPEDKKIRYGASLAVDGLLQDGWGEGEDGYGEGSWLEIDLGQATEIAEVNIWPGNLSEGKKSYREYSRPKKVQLTIGDTTQEVVFLDRIQRFDVTLDEPVTARTIKIEVTEVYEGFVFSDLFIAEVAVNFNTSREQIQPVVDWLATDAAQAKWDAHDEKIKDAFRAISAAEFGDDEQLAWIMDQAGDGSEFMRGEVPRRVDVGYRAAALKPDETAIDALAKLKDANSIPAIEMAQLRSTGAQRRELEDLVEIFYAYQDLIGGANLNVPYWGESGWSLGQIQSFGEPTPIEINPEGDLYIADIGNNRVQRFTYEGRADKAWGGSEPNITDVWFDKGRAWYVSGAAPGDKNNQFQNPLDIELIPVGEGTGFAVLDATMRVQTYDEAGRPMIGWPVNSNAKLDDGVGGEAYLAWVPKKKRLMVVLGDELIAYNLDAEELGRWELEDGTPNGLEVGKNNKLYFIYGRDVVLYDVDGFRHGVIWDEDVLGEGFEDMDLTIDQDGKLWIVTDQGWVHKMKSHKKVDYSVKFSDISLIKPRIAVQDDILYCVDRDRIIRLDALQAKIDAEELAEEEAEAAALEAAGE
jgi:KaiC/GvpD/RAD55 family RecA-like ATPase